MNEPSFDHIDFGPGYDPELSSYRIEDYADGDVELRMIPPVIDEAFLRARELQRDMLEEMNRRSAEAVSEALSQCAEAPEVTES